MPNRRRKGRRTFGATRQLPSGRWQASYLAPDGTRRKAPETFPAAADANAWLTNVEKSIGAGRWRPPELAQETFGDYGTRWLAQRVDLRPRTAELYSLLWRLWLEPDLGNLKLATMSAETFRAWYIAKQVFIGSPPQPWFLSAIARRLHGTISRQSRDPNARAFYLVKPRVGGPTWTRGPRPLAMEDPWSDLCRAA
jgi:hypothetical protein